jgi:hypothetical protein
MNNIYYDLGILTLFILFIVNWTLIYLRIIFLLNDLFARIRNVLYFSLDVGYYKDL